MTQAFTPPPDSYVDVYYERIRVVAKCDGAIYVSIKANKKILKQNNDFGVYVNPSFISQIKHKLN